MIERDIVSMNVNNLVRWICLDHKMSKKEIIELGFDVTKVYKCGQMDDLKKKKMQKEGKKTQL